MMIANVYTTKNVLISLRDIKIKKKEITKIDKYRNRKINNLGMIILNRKCLNQNVPQVEYYVQVMH